VVTDGSIRDSLGAAECGIPIFTNGVSATINLALHHAVDFQVPIGCAGVPVYPHDVLVGDNDGVVVIPRNLADIIAGPAIEQHRLESFLREKIADGAALPGVYPPSEAVMLEYEQYVARQGFPKS
jgi:regulator of RNase E activity RraA